MRPSLVVGILSDTHVPYRLRQLPTAVFQALEGVDVILHAGDVDNPEILLALRKLAPVHAVRGNLHLQDLSSGGRSLPEVVELCLTERRVVLTHGVLPGLPGLWFKLRDLGLRLAGASENSRFNRRIGHRLVRRHPGADVIVFGHTHRAFVERLGGTLLVNPGAVCPTLRERPTIARMALSDGDPRVEIVPLDVTACRSRD